MVVDHSDDENDKNGRGIFIPPSGKLAALSRKGNEINELMNSKLEDKNLLQSQYYVYLEKLKIVEEACMNQTDLNEEETKKQREWWQCQNSKIVSLCVSFDKYMLSLGGAIQKTLEPALSDITRNSGASSRISNTSSGRVRLAEKKARLTAKKIYNSKLTDLERKKFEENKQIEEKEMEHKIKKRELKAESLEVEHQILENELSKLDDIADLIEVDGMSDNPTAMKLPTSTNMVSMGQDRIENGNLLEVLSKQTDISLKIMKHQEKAELPKREIEIFDGEDVTKYRSFIQNFTQTIEIKCDKRADCLYYLEQYTAGVAKQIVKSCNHQDPVDAYEEALRLFEEEFGNEYRTAIGYLEKLENWPSMKSEDGEGMKTLSIYLMTCANNMGKMATMNQLNSPKEIMHIVKKLPFECRKKWRYETLKLIESQSPVTFGDLVKFVRLQSKLINQPLFGDIKDESYLQKSNNSATIQKRSLATKMSEDFRMKSQPENNNSTQNNGIFCEFCSKSNHELRSCNFFVKLSYDERIDFMKKLGLCFGCTRKGHMSNSCLERLTCSECDKRHPTVLHINRLERQDRSVATDANAEEINIQPIGLRTTKFDAGPQTGAGETKKYLCTILPIKIKMSGQNNYTKIYAALDSCSEGCFIDSKILQKLDVRTETEKIKIDVVGNLNSEIEIRVLNNLELYDIDESLQDIVPVVYAQTEWPFTSEDSPQPDDLLEHLNGVPFNFIDSNVSMIIGMNRPEQMKTFQIIEGQENGAYASLHKLGWALNGPVIRETAKNLIVNRMKAATFEDIENKLNDMYREDYKDCHVGKKEMSQDELKWKKLMENSIQLKSDHHYQLNLPLKDDIKLPTNRNQVYRIFETLRKKLDRNEDLYTDYSRFMMMMLQRGYMEKVPIDELKKKAWYLTHHAVYHKQKQKIRVVFNCSLKCCGISLNDALYKGPDLTNTLIGVILRFREAPVAFMADIEKMFFQVQVSPQHRDHLRLLWVDDVTKLTTEYRLTVHLFGAISSPSVANFALQQTTIDASHFSESAKTAVHRNFYVDDLLCSVNTHAEAAHLLTEVKDLVSHGGFNLTGVVTNSEILMKLFADDITNPSLCKEVTLKTDNFALGLLWNVQRDTLKVKWNNEEKPVTRRGVLSVIHGIYDPLGLSGPALIEGKKIFQDSCQLKLPWDSTLPPDLYLRWNKWKNELPLLASYEIQRSCRPAPASITQLHFFSDGSERAYGSVVYARYILENGDIYCSPILAKARLTPLKTTTFRTIPRIELNGAKLSIVLKQLLTEELDYQIDQIFYWTDSSTVLHYLNNNNKQFTRFVANRISYILDNSHRQQWRFVPGSHNPADCISRGIPISKFVTLKLWKFGPEFLWKPLEFWPDQNLLKEIPIDKIEVTKTKSCCAKIVANQSSPIDKILDFFSCWYKLKRAVAWLLRYKGVLSRAIVPTGTLKIKEMSEAEIAIVRHLQEKCFKETLQSLKNKRDLGRNNSLRKLDPFLDERNILRVGGRLEHSYLNHDSKHPIILPNKDSNVEKLIFYYHKILGHMGRGTITTYLRRKYWIIGLSSTVKMIQFNCATCRRLNANPRVPKMSSLPSDRLIGDNPPFTNTGLDYFGPFDVTNGRKHEKRYGIVFTCLSSRAIHLEMAYSLSTDSFLHGFRRFLSRRGNVRIVRSDNGTNLTSGCQELKKCIGEWNQNVIQNWMIQRNLEWRFQPPSASHFGGVFERVIRSVRKVLNGILREQPLKLNDEQLNTLFREIESILNCRPLTEISDDKEDLNALTPNHLLMLHEGATFPPGLFTKNDSYMQRKWKQVQHLSDLFWTRFRREYLPLLQQRNKWTNEQRNFVVGDLVLLTDQLLPRNQWSLGRVTKVHPDKKGIVRSVLVRVAKYRGKKTDKNSLAIVELERPSTKLILISSHDSE